MTLAERRQLRVYGVVLISDKDTGEPVMIGEALVAHTALPGVHILIFGMYPLSLN